MTRSSATRGSTSTPPRRWPGRSSASTAQTRPTRSAIVTVPEVLSVIELASHDLNELAVKYVPGSHLMTVDHWRTARKAVDWYRQASNVYWLASAVFDPIKTATRYVAAKYGMGKPLEMFQQNVILWFYSAYVREFGFYLIELYSGRLKVGTARYRELMKEHAHEPGGPPGRGPRAERGGDGAEGG